MTVRICMLFFLSFLTIHCFGQEYDTIWFNSDWKEIQNKSDRHFYRVIQETDSSISVKDFYPDNKIQMEGVYASIDLKVKNGEFNYYHRNGMLSLNALYLNDSLMYYIMYDEKGNRDKFRFTKEFLETLTDEEKIEFGLKPVDKVPTFPGGQSKLIDYLSNTLKYPNEARKTRAQGQVLIKFTVAKNGNIKKVKPMNQELPILETEALRVIELMPKWEPAIYKDKPVPYSVILPITFKLE